jgi:hypothetical protein
LVILIDKFDILGKLLNCLLLHPCFFPLFTANIGSKATSLARDDLLLYPIEILLRIRLVSSATINNTLTGSSRRVELGSCLALNLPSSYEFPRLGVELVLITLVGLEGIGLRDMPHRILLRRMPW